MAHLLKIKRPTGVVDTVDFTAKQARMLTWKQFLEVAAANAKAGSGELLSSTAPDGVMTPEIAEAEQSRRAQIVARIAEHKARTKAYDDAFNEGGEGYNPYID